MARSDVVPVTIGRLFDAVYPSFAMLAGMELDLFTALDDGPLGAEELGGLIGAPVKKLGPLLYALVAAGLLAVDEGLFANTEEASVYLVRGKAAYIGGLQQLTANNWSRVLKTAETIRSGRIPEQIDYHAPSAEEMAALFRGLYPGAVADARRLMRRADFAACRSLLDVGGGSGALAITMARENPQLQATVLELPSVTAITQGFIDEAQMAGRVRVLAGDAVRAAPPGSYDVVVARHLIQVLSADDSRALLANLAPALQPGGRLYLLGWVLDDSRSTPANIAGYNLVLLTAYENGEAYTEGEYRSWLGEAGFTDIERVLLANGSSIIAARKEG